jgi:hypothetical protein
MKIITVAMIKTRLYSWFLVSMIITIIIPGCSLTNQVINTIKTTQTPDGNSETAQLATITFYVDIPDDTPPDQPILLSILDEVTGLGLNPKRYPMQKNEAGKYALNLQLPIETTVKYRYSRKGDVTAEEHTSDGRAVRYRMFHVEAPGEVNDIVSRWNDTDFQGPNGRISGVARDSMTGLPIPGLLVTVGGSQVITASDGSFLIEGLPPGTHNIVVYSPNGQYRTSQHGAVVASESTTPAPMDLIPTSNVEVTFLVQVPERTPPAVPIRLIGNLYQLGNTFADLSGGVSTLASRAPVLSPLPDGSYGVILKLPVGVDIKYKYSLGDGFWNTEREESGGWVIRQLVVPGESSVVEDSIQAWNAGNSAPITFDLTTPENTPTTDDIYIQFNPYGWTEPIPMWHLEGNRWAYILFSPLDMIDEMGYRYCRSGQCGIADDIRTPGPNTSGQIVRIAEHPQDISDQVDSWAWLEQTTGALNGTSIIEFAGNPNPGFVAGVEFQDGFQPSWMSRLPETLDDVQSTEANWLILTPSWTLTRMNSPVLEPVAGQDPTWLDTFEIIRKAQKKDLNIALRPVAHFPRPAEDWWLSAPRDFSWWVSWFDRYESFILHHADLAQQTGAKSLILGGDWLSPALPNGKLSDGTPSNVPLDAESRYTDIIARVKERFNGAIGWSLTYPQGLFDPPDFLAEVNYLYILWSEPLSIETDTSLEEMQAEADRIITSELYPVWRSLSYEEEIGIILSLAYPSIQGSTTGCINEPEGPCSSPESLDYPIPDYPMLTIDMGIQAQAYHAIMSVISLNEWINGVVTHGYYPPTDIHDKSTSIHGKPTEEILKAWFERILGLQP